MGRLVVYYGTTRTGTKYSGYRSFAPGELAAFVEAKYRARWQELTCYLAADNSRDDAIAEISRRPAFNRRTWWAEDDTPKAVG